MAVPTVLATLLGSDFFLFTNTVGGTIDFAQKIGQFLGYIDDVGKDVQELKQTPYNTGIANLKYAHNENKNISKSLHYIQEATQNFTNALSLEKRERFVKAYLGLIFCFFMQGEIDNVLNTLNKFVLHEIIIDNTVSLKIKKN
ncbi:MAG: hypothetical protein KME50_10160 [Nostoc desertorum CM1-VF14]|jgi:predicted PurR-regulated permease PerM|nr:hypothetical protein [Nostoc desertorum CM1-VF14]